MNLCINDEKHFNDFFILTISMEYQSVSTTCCPQDSKTKNA